MNIRLQKLKKSRLFVKGDAIAYLCYAALVVALFCAFVFPPSVTHHDSLEILYAADGEEVIFTYSFAEKSYEINGKWADKITVERQDDGLRVEIAYEKGRETGRNVLFVSDDGKATMIDADCSFHRDCTLMKPVTGEGGSIICAPHHLIVRCGDATHSDPVLG